MPNTQHSQNPEKREPFFAEQTLTQDAPLSSELGELGPQDSLIQVEVLGGPMDGMTHFSSRGELVAGRSEGSDFQLKRDKRISGHHARLFLRNGLVWLEDLASTNGTFIGKERIEGAVPVAPGVQFTIGYTLIEILA